jgi:hypothetical protein
MKVILLSIADMFIKFTVKNKSPHLETLLFLNFLRQDIEIFPSKNAAKSCTSSAPG